MTPPIPIFEERITVPSYFVGEDSRMTVSSLFSLLTEVSNRHASLLNAGWHQLRERGYFWVITRMRMEINRMPEWTEPVLLRSWVRKSDAATSPRDFELIDANGNVIVAASSVWAILDIEHGRPQRMSAFDADFPVQERSAMEHKPQKVKALTIPEAHPEPKRVCPSDIDMNHHVNNARYIQWAFDTIDNDFRQRHKLTAMTVNFLGQAKLGDTYAICSASEDGKTFRTAIVSAGEPQEFCRIETEWHPIEQ